MQKNEKGFDSLPLPASVFLTMMILSDPLPLYRFPKVEEKTANPEDNKDIGDCVSSENENDKSSCETPDTSD